eukprot:6420018-Ditylum_brightwellii.AAC.1
MDAWYECVDEQSFINRCVKNLNHCYEKSTIGDESSTAVNMNNKDENESNVKVDSIMLLLNPWDSKEYKTCYGMEKDEIALDKSINAMLEIFKRGMR